MFFSNSNFRYIFDDEPVKEDETKQVVAQQYGGEEEVISISLARSGGVGWGVFLEKTIFTSGPVNQAHCMR